MFLAVLPSQRTALVGNGTTVLLFVIEMCRAVIETHAASFDGRRTITNWTRGVFPVQNFCCLVRVFYRVFF